MEFLPTTREEAARLGWDELDVIIVSGDAYVDHPAWAAAILGRFLVAHGYRVGVLPQPDWRDLDSFGALGRPRLCFAVSAGNMDSMVNHYTADKKKRREDLYSPGGQAGLRPDRATIVYTSGVRHACPGVPVVIGGVEASLRRLAHYDYWSEQVRRSLLIDAKADLLVYGMGEFALLEIAQRLERGEAIGQIVDMPGTCVAAAHCPAEAQELPSFEEVQADPQAFALATRRIHENLNPFCARPLAQRHAARWVIQNPPPQPLSSEQLDSIYDQPFARRAHPRYEEQGGIPALTPVQFSVVTHRGCFGGCAFCSLGLHQGKFIQSRSAASLEREVAGFASHPDFRGTVPDVGGPSANMYGLAGRDKNLCRRCRRESCLFPKVCANLETSHEPSLKVLRRLRRASGVRHLFVASGVRYDLVLHDRSGQYLRELCEHHVSGQMKVAPEHVSERVCRLMHKPGRQAYEQFARQYHEINRAMGRKQYLIPYFISAHPGSELEDTVQLAEFVRDELGYHPEQVQNFTPTPMTVSTCMYYTGLEPGSGQPVSVPRSARARRQQRALLQYRDPANRREVIQALRECGREDLIGPGRRSLVNGPGPGPAGPGKPGRPPVSKHRRPKRAR